MCLWFSCYSMNHVIFPALTWRFCLMPLIYRGWLCHDVHWLMWHPTDPPDTSFDEKLLSLSIHSPQMKSYINRFWRDGMSATLKMMEYRTRTHAHTHTHADTHKVTDSVLSKLCLLFWLFYLSVLNHSSWIGSTVADQQSLEWCKARSGFESWNQFCLFLDILLNSEDWSAHWA